MQIVIRTNQISFIQSRASWQLTMTTLAIMRVGNVVVLYRPKPVTEAAAPTTP